MPADPATPPYADRAHQALDTRIDALEIQLATALANIDALQEAVAELQARASASPNT